MEQTSQQARQDNDTFLQIPFVLAGGVILFNILISVLALKHLFAMNDGILSICVFTNVGAICAVSLLGLAAVTQWGIKNNLRQDRDLALSRKEWITRTWIGYAFSFLFSLLVSTGVSALTNPFMGLFFFFLLTLMNQTVKNTKETCLYMITVGLATIAMAISFFIMFTQSYESACRVPGEVGQPSFCETATPHHEPAHDSGSAVKEKANPNAPASK